MDSDRSVLSKLLLRFMDLSNEVNETFPSLRHSLFWPIGELELADGSRLAVLTNMRTTDQRLSVHSSVHPVPPMDSCICLPFFPNVPLMLFQILHFTNK